jgi:TPP-dependent pyruvate/acetoin dehydrogenase alpha subunit
MSLSNEQLLDFYYALHIIRKFEETVDLYAKKGVIPGFLHLSIGQEAAQAGVIKALRPTDYKYPDHRGHGAILMCGTDKKRVMAEIFGKATGINGGRGGSMHVNDINFGNMGFNGIQGSITLTALGTAFASKYKGRDDVSVVFMGDGTLGEGACHESINLAATWKLPVIYILINNQYAISTHYTQAHPQKQLATWADGYGVPNEVVDGNDVEKVYEATMGAVERARKGDGPTLLELMTYRWQGHFAGDPAAYRPEEEVKAWKDKCPVKRLKQKLLDRGSSQAELSAIEERVRKEIEEMVKFCLESPDPEPKTAVEHVYAGRKVQGK